jgi:hypothetical protein
MSEDEDRRALYEAIEASIGARPAEILMSRLAPASWPELATRADLAATEKILRAEITELRAHVDSQLPRIIAANVGSLVAVAGLLLAMASYLR